MKDLVLNLLITNVSAVWVIDSLLLLSKTFKIFETTKANYHILRLAFFAFYQDTINVSLPKNYKLRVALTPTNYQSAPIADIHIPVAHNHSVFR